MTAIDRVNVAGLGIDKEVVRKLLNRSVWSWYREHQEEILFEKKVFFFSIKLRIKDVRGLIERIAGPEVTA